jgi:hypothetical protein
MYGLPYPLTSPLKWITIHHKIVVVFHIGKDLKQGYLLWEFGSCTSLWGPHSLNSTFLGPYPNVG